MFLIDKRGMVNLVNKKAVECLGRKKNELQGARIEDLISVIDEIGDTLAWRA